MKYLLTLLVMMSFSFQGLSHEGHDKTPGTETAPHGGQLKETDQLHLELVNTEGGFKLYPLDHDMKAVALSEIKIMASMTLPKKKKTEPIELTPDADFFKGKVDAKGVHRYSVNLEVTYKGKTKKLKFNVEP